MDLEVMKKLEASRVSKTLSNIGVDHPKFWGIEIRPQIIYDSAAVDHPRGGEHRQARDWSTFPVFPCSKSSWNYGR